MYKFAITRPITTLMFALSLMFFGATSISKIPVALMPKVEYPAVRITTIYPGANVETMETKVTDKIEEAVGGIDGIKRIYSSSVKNVSIVFVLFELDKELTEAVNDVRDKVGSIQLDSGIENPQVEKIEMDANAIISLFMTSDNMPMTDMMKHADKIVKPMLQRISGVGNVNLLGYRDRVIKLYPDPTLMNKYGITYSQIASAVGQENVEIDGGTIIAKANQWNITTDASTLSLESIGEIRIAEGIKLSDIAVIEDSLEEEKTYSAINKTQGVFFEVIKVTGENDIKVADGVLKAFPDIQAASKDYELSIFDDTTEYIRESIDEVKFDLILGAFLATFIVFIFLRSPTITIVAALSLPVSIFGVFAMVHFMGYTLNMMTLLAITLSIGIIIDDAIVVIENIHKKIEAGFTKREAAYEGVKEIGFAIVAISAMLLSVFVPVGSMGGDRKSVV